MDRKVKDRILKGNPVPTKGSGAIDAKSTTVLRGYVSLFAVSVRVFVIAAMGWSVLAYEEARAQTLSQALAAAYTSNPQILAARRSQMVVDEQVPTARAGWLPNLSAEATVGVNRRVEAKNTFSTVPLDENLQTQSRALRVTQNVFSGGGQFARLAQAKRRVAQGRAELERTQQQILFSVVEAYLNIISNQAVLQLSSNNERFIARQLEATNDRFEVGETTLTDVSQAESRLSAAKAQSISAKSQLVASKAILHQLVGRPIAGDLSPPNALPAVPPSLDMVQQLALRDNPSMTIAQFAARAASESIDVARANLLPSVTLNGEVRQNLNQTRDDSETIDLNVNARLTIPLYQGGGQWSRLRAARKDHARLETLIEFQRRDLIQTAKQSWEALLSARAQIAAFIQAVKAQQVALDGVRQESIVGSRTVVDVLDAEQELLTARVNLVRARRDEAVATYQILFVIGRMHPVSLQLPVRPYDPTEHFNEVEFKFFGR